MKKLIYVLTLVLMTSACGPNEQEVDPDTGIPKKDFEKIEADLCGSKSLNRVDTALQGKLGDIADGYTQGLVLAFQYGNHDCLPKSSESGLTFAFIFSGLDNCISTPSMWQVKDRISQGQKVLFKLQAFDASQMDLSVTENASTTEFTTKTGAKVFRCQ